MGVYFSSAMTIVVNRDNVYQTPISAYDDYIYQHSILANRMWEEEVVETVLNHLEPGTDVVDIGANIGLITLGVLQRAKERGVTAPRIHCFECDINTFQLLRMNVAPFSASVALYPFAVGDTFQLCNIQMLEKNEGCNHIYRTVDGEGETAHDYFNLIFTDAFRRLGHCFIPCVPLDSVLYQFQERRVSVLKIDVEGFERKVLRGAKAFLALHRPVVVVEAWSVNVEEVIAIMKEMGYLSYSRLIGSHHNMNDYVFYPDVDSTTVSSVSSETTR
jgi:FkbM family methyltransferase